MKRFLVTICAALSTGAAIADPEVPATGTAKTGYIGFHLTPGLDGSDRPVAIVDGIVPSSPASKAGMRRGDTIRSVNGIDVSAGDVFARTVHEAKPDDLLTFVIVHAHSTSLRAVTVKVGQYTPEAAAKLQNMKTGDLKSVGIPTLVYIPQRLCYTGISFGEAMMLSVAPQGSVNLPLAELEQCRQVVEPCQPLGLVQQTGSSTTVKRGARKYRLEGNWKPLTFKSETECNQSRSTQQSETAEATHP